MPLSVSTQKIHTWKKRIQNPNLKGSTYFCQESGEVWVSASADHQPVCQSVLGESTKDIGLDSYVCWNNVSATDLVEILYKIDSV